MNILRNALLCVLLLAGNVASASPFLAEAEGDLDRDGMAERVTVENIPPSRASAQPAGQRVINIYRRHGMQWQLWHSASGAVMSEGSGGMLGDAFDNLTIERGCLVISHYGGGGDARWGMTHRYRYDQGRWRLIGATIEHTELYSSRRILDFNLATGKAIYTESRQDDSGQDHPTYSVTWHVAVEPVPLGYTPGSQQLRIPGRSFSISY